MALRRRHGWYLPLHTLQVAAITVFFTLVIAFYIFFAPFLGSNTLEYVAIAVYSPVVLSVFLLYIRCTAIDPSDPGVLALIQEDSLSEQEKSQPLSLLQVGTERHTPELPIPAWGSTIDGKNTRKEAFSFLNIGLILCAWMVKGDNCREDDDRQSEPLTDEDDVLFCTICNTEVRKYSKHCRSCNKCVDGFDHHCRWLNNCVGKKNYISFISLMASSLAMLGLECSIGIAVLVHCFVKKDDTSRLIADNLGNGFSRAPFAVIVALCTVVVFLACIPLGELFIFHIILMRKGITTYEYVVAMRTQNETQEGERQSIVSSPVSSIATGLSGSSPRGSQQKGAWCTPPRVFVDHQDEIIPHLSSSRAPSTIDPDAEANTTGKADKTLPLKHAVKINPWKLAKLNPNEAARAAAKARERSSVLRPLGERESGGPADNHSVAYFSTTSSTSIEYQKQPSDQGTSRDERNNPNRITLSINSPFHPSPNSSNASELPKETPSVMAYGSFGNSETPSIVSEPESGSEYPRWISGKRVAERSNITRHMNPSLRENRSYVSSDYGQGKFISASSPRQAWVEREEPYVLAHPKVNTKIRFSSQDSIARSSNVSAPSETLLYSGTSIFFGGPLSVPLPGSSSRAGDSVHLPPEPPVRGNETRMVLSRQGSGDSRAVHGSYIHSQSPVFIPSSKQRN